MITGALGLYAVNSVVESGRLVVRTYDKPLMAISYARLAQADFNALELAIERLARIRIQGRFGGADQRPLQIGQSRPRASPRSAPPPQPPPPPDAAAQAFDAWRSMRDAPPSPGQREMLREQTARVLESLDLLGELTADDGFRDRETSLASDRALSPAEHPRHVPGAADRLLVAMTLARKMVTPIAAASHAAGRIAAGNSTPTSVPAARMNWANCSPR
jgi:hypothetical protein